LSPIIKTSLRPKNPKYPNKLKTLGDHIRAKRLDLRLEQQDVAKMIGVDAGSINNWELNHCAPAVRYYPKIVDFLGYCNIQYPVTAGDQLRLYRMYIGYSIKRLAKFLGVDPTSVQSWETGKRKPTRYAMDKMEKLWQAKEK
jgi:transcriptional regulator with XRE-family HTH domain